MKQGKTIQSALIFLVLAIAVMSFSSASSNSSCSSLQYNWSNLASNVCDYGVSLDGFAGGVNGRTPCSEGKPAQYVNGVLVSSASCSDTYKKQQMTLNCIFALSNNTYEFSTTTNPTMTSTLNKGTDKFIVNGETCTVVVAASAYNPYYICGNLKSQPCFLPDEVNFVAGGNEYFSNFMVNMTCDGVNKIYNWSTGYSFFNISDRSFKWNPVDESWAAASFGYNNTKFLQQVCSLNNTNTTNSTTDTTAPVIVINSPNQPLYNSTNILFNFTITDNSSYNAWFNVNGTNLTYLAPVSINLTNGNYTLRVYANDSFGNFNSANFSFVINTSAFVGNNTNSTNQTNVTGQVPAVVLLSPINLTYNSSGVLLNATANQAISNWFYSLDGGLNHSFNIGNSFINLVNGSHSLSVYANNSNGTGVASVRFSVYLTSNGTSTNTTVDDGGSDYNTPSNNDNNDNNVSVVAAFRDTSSKYTSSLDDSGTLRLEEATTAQEGSVDGYFWLILSSLILAVLILIVLIVKVLRAN